MNPLRRKKPDFQVGSESGVVCRFHFTSDYDETAAALRIDG